MTKVETKNSNLLKQKHTNHHDIFFKEVYSNPRFALEIFNLIFSKEELEAYDWTKLNTEKDTFKDKRADLVFSVPLKKNPKTNLKIFILLEHKSSYNRQLFTQLLNYQILLYNKTIQEMGRPMPIIPVLFYHGKEPWKWKRSFQEAVFWEIFPEIPTLSWKSMLNYELRLLDTQDPKIEDIFKDKGFKSRGALYLLKEIWFLKPDILSLEKVINLFSDFFG